LREDVRIHAHATGRVQGVWYRAGTQEAARRSNVRGWVRNLPDGSVEAVFEGDADDVNSVVEWCRSGPPHAIVESLVTRQEAPEGLTDFEIIG
jgi:acylphosphatase